MRTAAVLGNSVAQNDLAGMYAWGKGGATNVRLARADATTLKSALKMAWQNIEVKSPKAARKKGRRDGQDRVA